MTAAVNSVYVFRRDFRLDDNKGILRCIRETKQRNGRILPVFLYNRQQVDLRQNPYGSDRSLQFMVESLADLDRQIKHSDTGEPRETPLGLIRLGVQDVQEEQTVLTRLFRELGVSHLYTNVDLTPFARERHKRLEKTCRDASVGLVSTEDYTLFAMQDPDTKTQEGTAYEVFSFLYAKRKRLHGKIPAPENVHGNLHIPWISETAFDQAKKTSWKKYIFSSDEEKTLYESQPCTRESFGKGGRENGLQRLHQIRERDFRNYENTRDDISRHEGTTRMSAYLKFGCVSIREFYHTVYDTHGIDHALIRELYFREFYYGIAWFYPWVLRGMTGKQKKNLEFKEKYQNMPWEKQNGDHAFKRWKEGNTGTPMVDAAMRQLNRTGFMHNRGRMIVAQYLTKDLLMDWRLGERYFASRLVDYDPAQNSAGWQWSASVGSDAAPYFRTFNPYTQMERFDEDAAYVKRWVPELENVSPHDLIRWESDKVRQKYKNDASAKSYPRPMVENHTRAAERAKEHFEEYAS